MTIRVLHFASGDGWGGAERVIETLMRTTHPLLEVEALLLNEGRLADVLRSMGIRVQVVPEVGRSFWGLMRDVRTPLLRSGFDVVHCHRYKELMLTVLSMGFRSRPIVVTVHGLEPRDQLTLRQFVRIWGSVVLARLRGVSFAAVSRELTSRLSQWPLSVQAAHIPNPMPNVGSGDGLPDLRKQFGWDRDRPLVGFIGRLEHVKGPDLFLDIARLGPDQLGYVIVGTGSMEKELRERCEAEGLSERLRFLGMVPDAAPFLRQLDVLAMTSRHEGTPMALLEAAACEVPVVAFGVGGIPPLLEQAPTSWSVASGDVEAFAGVLRALIQDLEGARRAAKVWAASIRPRYDQSAVIHAYLELYARCISGRTGEVPREDSVASRAPSA